MSLSYSCQREFARAAPQPKMHSAHSAAQVPLNMVFPKDEKFAPGTSYANRIGAVKRSGAVAVSLSQTSAEPPLQCDDHPEFWLVHRPHLQLNPVPNCPRPTSTSLTSRADAVDAPRRIMSLPLL